MRSLTRWIPPHPSPLSHLMQGSRFRRLAETLIARMYHSTAALTIDGTILVAGCDRCYRFEVGGGPHAGVGVGTSGWRRVGLGVGVGVDAGYGYGHGRPRETSREDRGYVTNCTGRSAMEQGIGGRG